MVDMAHVAGLVAGGAHPSPVPYADVVTMTTHKTLRGPWGGLILCKAELADAIDKAVFPGTQGGPHLHAIAAKAVMLHLCGQEEFKTYATTVVSNAHVLAHELMERDITLVTGGTDNHLMLIDLRPLGVQGRSMQLLCDEAGITLNANTFPYHGGSPFNPNGLRLGTPSVTSRGMHGKEMIIIADLLSELLHHADDPSVVAHVREGSLALCQAFPLPYRV
jgi:glycine hydroxymethyltransferase